MVLLQADSRVAIAFQIQVFEHHWSPKGDAGLAGGVGIDWLGLHNGHGVVSGLLPFLGSQETVNAHSSCHGMLPPLVMLVSVGSSLLLKGRLIWVWFLRPESTEVHRWVVLPHTGTQLHPRPSFYPLQKKIHKSTFEESSPKYICFTLDPMSHVTWSMTNNC